MSTTSATLTAANFVDGHWIAGSGEQRESVNPTTGKALIQYREASLADVDEAVETATTAALRWERTSPLERSELLLEVASRLASDIDQFTSLIVAEVGKPIRESREEVARSVAILRYHAQAALDPNGLTMPHPNGGDALVFTERRPLGAVGLIMPWNFPVAIPLWKIAPALAYGNTVIMKAAPHAARLAVELAHLLCDLPRGVFTLLQGGPEVGQAVARSRLAALSFTGSNAAGDAVAESALATGARLQAELGGKNASVVLADADMEQAVEVIAHAAMGFAGQKCTATSRVVVEERVSQEFRSLLAARIDALNVADPADETTDIGPLIDKHAVHRSAGFVERALEDGAELLTGGAPREALGPTFYAPTLLANVDAGSELAQTEVFGPVVALLTAVDADDALRIANASRYGLSAAVFTRDLDLGLRFARHLEAGVVRVNGPTSGVLYNAPFGPAKDSGIGLPEQGKSAQLFFTRERTVTVG